MRLACRFVLPIAVCLGLFGQTRLQSVHKIFIEPMPNGLDQYLRAEIVKQMKNVNVVLDRNDADAVLTGVNNEAGQATKIVGRYFGVVDTDTAVITLVDKDGKTILWSDEAGDRNLFFGALHSGGERKVANRLVEKLKKAMHDK